MARARLLKPGFFQSDQLAQVSAFGRLLFAGLWTIADREGRLEDRPLRIKAQIFPYDDVDVAPMLQELATAGLIQRYEVEGATYICLPSFTKHQHVHRAEPASVLPPPDGENPGASSNYRTDPVIHQTDPAEALNLNPLTEAFSGSGSLDAPSEAAAAATRNCMDAWTNATGNTFTRQQWDMLEGWVERVGEAVVLKAIEETGRKSAKSWSYTEAILKRWSRDGLPTEQYQPSQDGWEEQKRRYAEGARLFAVHPP